ncbi:hypothetical protein BV22DRAFT_778686 [Leucogyrophana mollusca]|uniref:Uncharacterized protein n=1 Tax=Leucogyrophana mollusca TaxID=85980 RepID=A0ACB8B4R5_9AGAM|nr:hypothetical protein BV22DRAFT_778686 [Leucogyrophana mollusca]
MCVFHFFRLSYETTIRWQCVIGTCGIYRAKSDPSFAGRDQPSIYLSPLLHSPSQALARGKEHRQAIVVLLTKRRSGSRRCRRGTTYRFIPPGARVGLPGGWYRGRPPPTSASVCRCLCVCNSRSQHGTRYLADMLLAASWLGWRAAALSIFPPTYAGISALLNY